MITCDVVVTGNRVHQEGVAYLPARSWPRARSRTTWSHRPSLVVAREQDECRKKVRRRLRTVRQRASSSRSNIVVLATAAKNLQTRDRRLGKSGNDKAVCQVLAGLRAHQPRNQRQPAGTAQCIFANDYSVVILSCNFTLM